jgi:hypothetical protein
MQLVFPFKNAAVNTLYDYYNKEYIKDFSDFKSGKDSWKEKHFYDLLQICKDRLPNFENEILQIINTTNQETIDSYFIELLPSFTFIKDNTTKEYLLENIFKWNENDLKKYSDECEKKGEEYAKHENRKMGHLQEYEIDEMINPLSFSFAPSNYRKAKRINYNFYCVEKEPDLINLDVLDEYLETIKPIFDEFLEIARKYGRTWQDGNIKSKVQSSFIKPIVFVEGEHDITYLNTAATHLGKEDLLKRVELRQRGGFRNLDKLWNILKEDSWETTPQTKIFLYDCDTNINDEDFGRHFKRAIPSQQNNLIKRGIENLFPDSIINKAMNEKSAFVDSKNVTGVKRGQPYTEIESYINKDEKKNFCDWILSNATFDDFRNFNIIFEIIENIIE